MIIKPKFKNFNCITSHPIGCEYNIYNQIYSVKKRNFFLKKGPKKVLIIGSSSGFGLASNIVTSFGFEAKIINVFLEEKKYFENFSSEGWYNIAALEKFKKILGLYSKNINCDAFSNECKKKVIKLIKRDLGKIDLVIYSISPKSRKLISNKIINISMKPIFKKYKNKTINIKRNKIIKSTIIPANQKEINNTIKIMGGEDWELWMKVLKKENVLENNIKTITYSYINNKIISPIYNNGTIGLAKNILNISAQNIHKSLNKLNGSVNIVILKPTITKSTYLNPFINLYTSILYKVMKKENLHEDCIDQIFRLMSTYLYNDFYITDKYNRIRIDSWEKRKNIQRECQKIWRNVNTNNFKEKTDFENCKIDFLNLFGFNFPEINYKTNINTDINIDIV
ncbi:MAG: enoyl-ACP reductase FabV [Enterobacteriaceae bacterium]